jgi:UDP-N-acetyl-D-glucosamine dehydrogenase
MSDCTRVVVVGQGYVGLPLAMRAVAVGHQVVGFDVDDERVKRLQTGESHVEDVPDEDLAHALASGRYRASSEPRSCAGFDVGIIAVPTPLREGLPDLSYIEASAELLARYVRPGSLVVLESTTYPGTTEELVAPALENGSGLVAGTDFFLGYSPERIDPGNHSWNFRNTPKVVSGIDAVSLLRVEAFYDSIVDTTVPVSGTREAELTKLVENTFRHVNIALVNELAMYAAELGIDVWEAIGAASTKPFGYMQFTPGPGVGGHCLPIDPSFLSWRVKRTLGRQFRFVELANDVNEHMPDYVVWRVMMGLNKQRKALDGSRILLLGLTYKRNTRDDRESPALRIADQLIAMGADVHAADPHVVHEHLDRRIEVVDATTEEFQAADAVVLITDHDAFDLKAVAAEAAYVLDTRNRVPAGDNVERL